MVQAEPFGEGHALQQGRPQIGVRARGAEEQRGGVRGAEGEALTGRDERIGDGARGLVRARAGVQGGRVGAREAGREDAGADAGRAAGQPGPLRRTVVADHAGRIACALGAGVTAPGDGLLIVGTCLASLVATGAVDLGGEPAGLYISTDRPGHWLRAMPAMVGTAALDRVPATTGARHRDLDALLEAAPPGASGVRVLPYFAPSGERAPFVEPGLRAELLGVSLETRPADPVRATCEGIGYAARLCLAAGLAGTLAVCGGGTRSPAWTRLPADVLGRPLRVVEGEVGARGAVLAAAARYGIPLDAAAWTEPTGVTEPDPDRAAYYAKGYEEHLELLARARERARRRPGPLTGFTGC
ncbi:hypothetical protein GCM10010339_08290 [Streptomyces alanosinicus]|uniref:Carbohydrate kinase FGGY C-terminal domain-containing protein n=1 Tax=Streptomyces alanosinicus TaxID=68171 RepID=A0A918YDH5_9ACTN|nr:hypothetical protein GCM10010339_08290 [Streptomyces alanosinicus]